MRYLVIIITIFLLISCKQETIVSDSKLVQGNQQLVDLLNEGSGSVYENSAAGGTTILTNPLFVDIYNNGSASQNTPDVVILSFGFNESIYTEIPMVDWFRLLDHRIAQFVDRGATCFVFLIDGNYYGASRIIQWNDNLRSLVGNHSFFNRPYEIRVADVSTAINSDPDIYTTDGVHFTDAGRAIVFPAIAAEVELCPDGRWNYNEKLKDGETFPVPLHVEYPSPYGSN